MKLTLALWGLFFAGPAILDAQETTGSIRGRVQTANGDPVAEAQITVAGPMFLGTRRARSAGDGVFQVLALPPGDYTVRIAAIGYRPLVVQGVQAQLGRITGLGDLALVAAAASLEELTITAPRMTLDPVRTTIGATLEASDYESLPAERDYTSLIAILPHVNTSYHGDPVNAGGSTGLENLYVIDGVNVTAPFRASSGTALPYNFVRSVEVRAGGYEAQYGRALGAIVNAITYTGTNDLEVSAASFFTHSDLAAEPKAEPGLETTSAYSYDVGVRVSGPVLRDRLWFSAAYNSRVDRADRLITGLGTYPDRRQAHLFAGKLTWQATPSTHVELSLFGDPTTQDEVASIPYLPGVTALNPDPYLHRLTAGGVTGSLRGSTMVGTSLLLEAALSRSTGTESFEGKTAVGRIESTLVDNLAGTLEGGVPYPDTVAQGRTAIVVKGTMAAGRHTAVLGAEYEDTRAFRHTRSGGAGYIERREAALFVADSQDASGEFHSIAPTVYLQDAWRATGRLTLNAGIRWSSQRFTGASGATAQRFPDQWQPRLGFSWQLGRLGSQRVFGSYGRFYQEDPLNLATLGYVDYRFLLKYYSADPREPGAVADSVLDLSALESDAKPVDNVTVERFDEVTLGFEKMLGGTSRLTLRGLFRRLGTTFQLGCNGPCYLGTPGRGDLAFLPTARRDYTALEVAVEGTAGQRLRYRASYVVSRTWGNYTGLYSSDVYFANPGINYTLQMPHQAVNSTGLLPNDRPHVLKLVGTWEATRSLAGGMFFTWQSGTPLNEFGVAPGGTRLLPAFLVPRGSAGRTPAIKDLNLRLAYQRRWARASSARVVLDLLHVGNPRTTVRIDQQHYLSADKDGTPQSPNPNYLGPIAYQPPMAARLGLEVSF